MKRLLARYSLAGLLMLLAVWPSWGQTGSTGGTGSTGSTGGSQPSQPAGGGGGTRTPSRPGVNPSANRQMQTPVYVDGRILTETGQPAPEAVSVALQCGMRRLQAIRTDLKGYFQFTLGAGVQGNMDLSAVDASMSPSSSTIGMEGMNVPGSFGGFGGGGGGSLTGCELRVSVPGYQPLTHIITDPSSLGIIDVGTLELRRITGVQGSAISATSLLAPSGARREFDRGVQDARNNNLQSATQRLEKAVAEYDKYAAAWYQLGTAYAASQQTEKALQAYEKAIAADPQYVPPYVGLAALELQNNRYESALASIDKALQLDPGIRMGVASYIQAVGNFRLNRLEAAEKSALEAEKGPHQNMPQLHALLTDIYLRKSDHSKAAAQIRAYLKESPRGSLAAELQRHLERIEKSPDVAAAQPQIAP